MSATILPDKNSKMNMVIFCELVGIGNLELNFGRESADRRTLPVINIQESGTWKV